jgi:DNA-binding IclR family transcriptional regulator
MVANVGRRSPLHTNASGKLLLAFQPPDVIADVLSRPLEAKTPSTVCNPQVLAEQLARARADGYATCWQEQEIGLCSVACPVFDYTGGVCAAIAIAGPAERIDEAAVSALAAAAGREARAISQKLGWAEAH